ncbi:L-fuconolactonase [Agromyces hippuratus]|uniref:L-fuconolactonase n=1 Tax=Agromyces hippuratus TaxID=286438 RepID=A0A852X984_9MICO|nr:amidohydrolase family protein [Agromyces hippuratus]NYG22435.1 L-fuconolactonase [Agromyces hippuratus]
MTGAADTPASIVDAHIHLWDAAAFELPWLVNVPALRGRYSAGDYLAAVGDVPVRAAVVVQAAESAAEAAWLADALDDARGDSFEAAMVVQFSPAHGDWLGRVQPAVDARGELPQGVRLPVHRRDPDWTDLDGLPGLLRGAEERGLVVEVLCRPDQVAALDGLAARHPRLVFVLDHLGLGASEPDAVWHSAVHGLRSRPNVLAKVSGLFAPGEAVAEGDARAARAVGIALEAFGPERLMFGSDWPMSSRAGGYAEVVERTAVALGPLTGFEREALWSGTVRTTYSALRDNR